MAFGGWNLQIGFRSPQCTDVWKKCKPFMFVFKSWCTTEIKQLKNLPVWIFSLKPFWNGSPFLWGALLTVKSHTCPNSYHVCVGGWGGRFIQAHRILILIMPIFFRHSAFSYCGYQIKSFQYKHYLLLYFDFIWKLVCLKMHYYHYLCNLSSAYIPKVMYDYVLCKTRLMFK